MERHIPSFRTLKIATLLRKGGTGLQTRGRRARILFWVLSTTKGWSGLMYESSGKSLRQYPSFWAAAVALLS